MYLLRASIEFSSESYEMVSFWDDYEKAKSYVEGTYNSEEGVLGWSGLDSRFGRINNTLEKPKLYFHLSRDDIMLLDFGKYTSAE